ncbi:MAG: FHA domain-containing protein [Anaerolineae bacterium]|nr:FHA domain-containing protein [Anaerolineae bacterium]MBN8617268.1 FHA domain-containing protein [Anaerolineae bacterium]
MSRADSERPILIIQDENQPPRHWPLSKDDVILGRDEECDLPLPIRQISRQHIRIYRQGELYFVEDLDSKNGTWVNGLQLKGSRELHDGDEIHVALAVRLRFIDSDATSPLSTEAPAFITGRLRLDPEARRVFIRGVELNPPLSLPQYRLLELLYVNTGRICTRDHVIETVWPEALGEGVSEQAIDALVRRLRDRLAELDPETQYVVTVRGHGFRLDNPPG